ncbi:MAG: hypothetical protein A2173_03135 [Planctomycetes bacterium RBG_13_44_8b]|nr:MAG: hypothetical protein A2173_03135 [Planctomycetes bacterium RBG_13_44_8b]
MVFNCPICGKKVEKRAEDSNLTVKGTDFFPFCSQRCRLVDLNAWLESQYVISAPVEEDKDDNPNEPENVLK